MNKKMMNKMAKQLFVAAVAFAAFTACSENTIAELDPKGVEEITPNVTPVTNSAVLTNKDGQQISSVSADMGTYYLDIKTDGAWYIETPRNLEFLPTKMAGLGSARVPVMIGNNWAEGRELSYKVHFLDKNGQSRRAGGTEQTVTQNSNTNLEKFKTVMNSNTFVGYGYYPAKHQRPELCTGVKIFKMDGTYVVNSLAPDSQEDYFYAHSEDVLDKVVAVNGHPGGNFGAVKMSLDLDNVNVTRKNNFEVTIMQKSLLRSVYSREIENWEENAIDANFTEGFKKCKDRFITQYKDAGTDETKKLAAAEALFHDVGTHFIIKGFLGSELNYRMAVAKSKITKATNVKAALDFKWQQQVKDTAKVDSAAQDSLKKLIPDSMRKNFVFHGGVMVSDSSFNAASATSAQVKARGGDVERVSILSTGGTLNCADLGLWLLSTEPEKAAMVQLNVEPIYRLFKEDGTADEQAARAYLVKLIDTDKKYSLKAAVDGFGKLTETKPAQ